MCEVNTYGPGQFRIVRTISRFYFVPSNLCVDEKLKLESFHLGEEFFLKFPELAYIIAGSLSSSLISLETGSISQQYLFYCKLPLHHNLLHTGGAKLENCFVIVNFVYNGPKLE